MQYDVVLEREERGYFATVPALPGVHGSGATREDTLVAVQEAIRRRLANIEVVTVDVDAPSGANGYSPAEEDLARRAARLRGDPSAPLTGKPWVDFAGHLCDLPEEDWEAYEAALRAIRAEGRQTDMLRGGPSA